MMGRDQTRREASMSEMSVLSSERQQCSVRGRRRRRQNQTRLSARSIVALLSLAAVAAPVESFAPPKPSAAVRKLDVIVAEPSCAALSPSLRRALGHDRHDPVIGAGGALFAASVSTESPTTRSSPGSGHASLAPIWIAPQDWLQHWAHVLPVTIPVTSNQWRKRTKLLRHKNWQAHDAYLSTVLPDHSHPPTVAWAQRYTSVDRLRAAFGENRNKFWGDLDAATTRRLYKMLLPTALLGLVQAGVHEPEQLAPLAYQARVAAKLYARERSKVPVRIMANLIDGFRQLMRTGRFRCRGMTYEQIWDKYRRAVLEVDGGGDHDDDSDVATRVCLKILERSCATNRKVDRWVLPDNVAASMSSLAAAQVGSASNAFPDLTRITTALEDDVRKLLLRANK